MATSSTSNLTHSRAGSFIPRLSIPRMAPSVLRGGVFSRSAMSSMLSWMMLIPCGSWQLFAKTFHVSGFDAWSYIFMSNGKLYFESLFWSAMLLSSGMAIMPAKNLINNLGLSDESTHFSGSMKTTPKAYRRIFMMKRHELEFPLKHPVARRLSAGR